MQEHIFIFKYKFLIFILLFSSRLFAQETEDSVKDEIISGPYSEYGEFESSDDEDSNERFFQYGRFFGIGMGAGYTFATGNAGKLYQGNGIMLDFRLQYWFDFQFALQLGIQNSKHTYNVAPHGLSDVNLFRTLFHIKYYIDTHDLSAPLTFIGPHVMVGGGFYQRTDNIGSGGGDSTISDTLDQQNAFGINFGGGLEITLKPKKVYLQIQTLIHLVQFKDDLTSKFRSSGIQDRTGNWIASGATLMWTW